MQPKTLFSSQSHFFGKLLILALLFVFAVPVTLTDVSLTTGVAFSTQTQTEFVVFYCTPVLEGVKDPSTVAVQVQWWIDDELEFEEDFSLSSKSSATLNQEHFKMGKTVRCTATARHDTLGTSTEKLSSQSFYAGIKILSPSKLILKEGGEPVPLSLVSTVPVTCNSIPAAECCLPIQASLDLDQCSNALGILDSCTINICSSNWNQTQNLALKAKEGYFATNIDKTVRLDLTVGNKKSHKMLPQWDGYRLPPQKVEILPSAVKEFCEVSAPTQTISTFDGVSYKTKTAGTYVLYRHKTLSIEVQANIRQCNLRSLCLCAVAIRSGETILTFDICTKGHLRAWAKSLSRDAKTGSLDVVSVDDGRLYKVNLPSGTQVVIGNLLTYVKIFASASDNLGTLGLCGTFDHNVRNEFMGLTIEKAANLTRQVISSACPKNQQPGCDNFFNSWSLQPTLNLFTGKFNDSTRATMDHYAMTGKVCHCTKESVNSQPVCHNKQCSNFGGKRGSSVFEQLLKLGLNPDFETDVELDWPYAETNAEEEGISNKSAITSLVIGASGGPKRGSEDDDTHSPFPTISLTASGPSSKLPPIEGWTETSASKFCSNFLKSGPTYETCSQHLDVNRYIEACKLDLLFSGNPRTVNLHVDHIKQDCIESYLRGSLKNDNLVESSLKKLLMQGERRGRETEPTSFTDVADSLCFNDCSEHGRCQGGN